MPRGIPTRAELEASRWVVRFDDVNWDERDVRRFRRWLAKSAENRAAYKEISRTWDNFEMIAKLGGPEDIAANDSPPRKPSRRALLAGLGAGAIALGAGSYIALRPDEARAVETGIGEIRTITLADSTRVILNAATKLDIGERWARLRAGEALFEIASGAVPFRIRTSEGEVITDAGTILVKVLGAGIRTTVIAGSATAARGLLVGGDRVDASAETEFTLGAPDLAASTIAAPRIAQRTMWREGMLAFDGETLAEATADIGRHTGERFAFADPALAELTIGGLIEARDLDAFLRLLDSNLAVSATRQEDGVILLSSTATFAP